MLLCIYRFLLCVENLTRLLHPIPVKGEVWHTIGVDLIDPLPETPRKNKYRMTVFSKWPEATALPDKTAIGVAEFLFHCFTRHGCCKIKITDQGREFVNKVPNKQQHSHVCLYEIVFLG